MIAIHKTLILRKNISIRESMQDDNFVKNIDLKCRIDTFYEAEYYKAGGVMQYVIGSIT